MNDFRKWWYTESNLDSVRPMDSLEEAWNAGMDFAAKRCKEIAEQRYLAENQAVEIAEKISEDFGV